ncbi:MAG: O-antigen ligase family protein [Lachnospiraceae bacterium]|jgi:hypothetical protein|nr:O-antigen ligase family protein [Lachnospiraceae bacterium]
MKTNYREKLTGLAAFLLLTEIFYFYESYITIAGFGVGYQYIGCMIVAALGFGLFLVDPDIDCFYHSVKTAGVLMIPYIIILLFSMTIWIFNFTPLRQIISGFFEPAYMILCLICAASLVYILRDQMMEYAFWALSTVVGVMVLQRILKFGVFGFFERLSRYLISMGNEATGVSLEATSFSYTFVFFGLYYIFHRKEDPVWKQLLRMLIILFGLLVTFKRSGFMALAFGFVCAFVCFRLNDRNRKLFLNFIIVLFILFAFFYIPIIRYGLFERIATALDINTSSRIRIYRYYADYYDFGITYLGRGLGWVRRLMASAERFNVGLQSVNVHCDYVRLYIELGFWGYLFWIFTAFPWVVKGTARGNSAENDAVILGTCVALASLRMTENISFLYSATLGMSITIMQCSYNTKYRSGIQSRKT